jgi:integrase
LVGVEQFLELSASKSTRSTYKSALKLFFDYAGLSIGDAERYFSMSRNYEEDIQNFLSTIADRPPLTVRTYLSAVKSYLLENDVELRQAFWKRLLKRIKGKRARTLDEVPAHNSTLRKIMLNMDIKGKALYLTLASSGMRIGEALSLKLDDLELDKEPSQIKIRGEYTKTGESRIAFISSEAREAIEQWLKQREKWIKSALKRAKGLGEKRGIKIEKRLEDPRVFPFSENLALTIWGNALSKAGLEKYDPSTRRRTLHPHVLRKWFRTKLGKVNPDFAEALMGHVEYLESVYRRHSLEDLANFYKENEHLLHVFTDTGELARLRAEVDRRILRQGQIVEGLIAENTELKAKIRRLEDENRKLKEDVNELNEAYKEESRELMKIKETLYSKEKLNEYIENRAREMFWEMVNLLAVEDLEKLKEILKGKKQT